MNNILLHLNQDVYRCIFSYLSYFPFTSMRMSTKLLYFPYSREIQKKLDFYHTSVTKISNICHPTIAYFNTKKIFIKRIMGDVSFRQRIIRIHMVPEPHLCLQPLIPPYYIKLYGRILTIQDFFEQDFIVHLDNYLTTCELSAITELFYSTIIDESLIETIKNAPMSNRINSFIYGYMDTRTE